MLGPPLDEGSDEIGALSPRSVEVFNNALLERHVVVGLAKLLGGAAREAVAGRLPSGYFASQLGSRRSRNESGPSFESSDMATRRR